MLIPPAAARPLAREVDADDEGGHDPAAMDVPREGRTGGQTATLEELSAHWPELFRHACRLMSNASDAKDLVQDTLERAMRALDQFQPGSNLRAWLYTIMVRRSRDHFRSARVRASTPLEPERMAAAEPTEPSEWCRVTDDQLRRAVGRLRPKFREVFELHALHHLPYQDIAARLDIPVNTVGTRLKRARDKLRDLLLEDLPSRGQS